MDEERFKRGLAVRGELMGEDVVGAAFEDPDAFNRPMQEMVTEFAWGGVWGRPGLDFRSRSILNLGLFAGLNRPQEMTAHIKVAQANGLSPNEIRECSLQAAIYCGMPIGMEMFRVATEALKQSPAEK